jgi:hypothetical protein
MLDPRDRQLLLEAFRPPLGAKLDRAIGTSFSLDLTALLVAPLAFTLFDWEDQEGKPAADHYALLAALREHSEKITVFCQAGQIAVPQPHQLLLSQLEDSVVEVSAPQGGVFHPKVWALRFIDEESAVSYRVLCLSRNLTFDRCWDTALVLDGELTRRTRGFAPNNPLGDFVDSLPGLAVAAVSPDLRASCAQIAHELRRVRFTLPEGFDRLAFWAIGLDGERSADWPFGGDVRRMLVVSPFLAAEQLGDLGSEGTGDTLVSRLESLDRLSADDLRPFDHVRVLSEAAEPEVDDETGDHGLAGLEGNDPPVDHRLSGLHAKLYVADAGWNARVWTGSANATNAAFDRNVEFLVELEGKKSRCGIEAILGTHEESVGVGDLLCPYDPREEALEIDPVTERLERALEAARRAIGGLDLSLVVDGGAEDQKYTMTLTCGAVPVDPVLATVQAWPVTGKQATWARELELACGEVARFEGLALELVTPFLAFHVEVSDSGRSAEAQFTRRLPLEGSPPERRDAVLRALLETRQGLLRFLVLLVGESGASSTAARIASQLLDGRSQGGAGSASLELPLLEALVQAVDRKSSKVESIQRVVVDLARTDDGRELLGAELLAIWEPIWAAYQETRA